MDLMYQEEGLGPRDKNKKNPLSTLRIFALVCI